MDEHYQPIFTSLPPENGTDAGCAGRVGKTLRAVLDKYPNGKFCYKRTNNDY